MLTQLILQEGKVTKEIREQYFSDFTFSDLRDWLEKNVSARHFPIEYDSTEIAIITPEGILLQRRSTDHDMLGMFGGVIENGETPVEGAIREILEETKLSVSESDLKFVEIHNHFH